jgi:hypothetical protein
VKAGVLDLDIDFTYDAQVAAFCTVESQIGRRAPALLRLQWGDVWFVKQAVMLGNNAGIHAFGCVLKIRAEKVIDTHNSTLIIFDVAGDSHLQEELLLTPSMQLLNLAVVMGVVKAADILTTAVGDQLPKVAGAADWCVAQGEGGIQCMMLITM